MGFCCATLPGGVAVGGQAAAAGLSQELSGTGARPQGALVFRPGQRWIWEPVKKKGKPVKKKKAVPTPGYSWVPSFGQKQLQGIALTGALIAQHPGVPGMMDGGFRAGHMQHFGEWRQ